MLGENHGINEILKANFAKETWLVHRDCGVNVFKKTTDELVEAAMRSIYVPLGLQFITVKIKEALER